MFDAAAVKQFFTSLAEVHSKPFLMEADGVPYLIGKDGSHKDMRKLDEPPLEPLCVDTLASLVAYREVYDAGGEETMFHVASPLCVRLISAQHAGLPFTRRHEKFCEANIMGARFFGDFYEPDVFTIWVMSNVLDSPEKVSLLRLVSAMKSEAVKSVESKDNGVAQSVIVKSGVSLVCEQQVKNPWLLRPYRTFREVPQPESEFILRMKGGGDGKPPLVGLFEADGGKWELDAAVSIESFIKEACPNAVVLR